LTGAERTLLLLVGYSDVDSAAPSSEASATSDYQISNRGPDGLLVSLITMV